MKTYAEKKCRFGTLTLDDMSMTQGQGRKC